MPQSLLLFFSILNTTFLFAHKCNRLYVCLLYDVGSKCCLYQKNDKLSLCVSMAMLAVAAENTIWDFEVEGLVKMEAKVT